MSPLRSLAVGGRQTDKFPQIVDLFLAEHLAFARPHALHVKGTQPSAFEADDMMPNDLKHQANLPFAAFMQNQLHARLVGLWLGVDQFHLRRRGAPPFDEDAFPQGL